MKVRKIISVSGVITNSSTEVFIISGPDALKAMVGSGVYRKFIKKFVYLRTDDDVKNFLGFSDEPSKFNHRYTSYNVLPPGEIENLWKACDRFLRNFPESREEIWKISGSRLCKELKGSVFYYDYIRNQKILTTLEQKFPKNDEEPKKFNYNYIWKKD